MTPTVAAALRAARLEAGLSQRQLAEHVGVGQPAISRIEAGQNVPTLPHFASLVRALELDPAGVLR